MTAASTSMVLATIGIHHLSPPKKGQKSTPETYTLKGIRDTEIASVFAYTWNRNGTDTSCLFLGPFIEKM